MFRDLWKKQLCCSLLFLRRQRLSSLQVFLPLEKQQQQHVVPRLPRPPPVKVAEKNRIAPKLESKTKARFLVLQIMSDICRKTRHIFVKILSILLT